MSAELLATGPAPAAAVRHVATVTEAEALAHELAVSGLRKVPVVVLSCAGGHAEPFGDAAAIKESVADLADVVLLAAGEVSWAFSRAMPGGTQVYGGAGRVYPVGHAWVLDLSLSPLRFAYSVSDRERITENLISDALHAAMRAGLIVRPTASGLRERSGTVKGVIGSRAFVRLDDGVQALVLEELTLPGVALDRLVTKGQAVTGRHHPEARRLDLRDAIRYADQGSALAAVRAAYAAGDVVLADVAAVADDAVHVRLLPELIVAVPRESVTQNPNDLLGDLFTVGEVVQCRVAGLTPPAVRLDDIDDDEVPRTAPSLLPGGPPWLIEPVPAPAPPPAQPRVPPPSPPPPPQLVPAAPRPSPLDFARRLGVDPAAARAAQPSNTAMVEARNAELRNELAAERATRGALSGELGVLRDRAAELEDALARAHRQIEKLQTRYRIADLGRQRATKGARAGKPDPEPLAFVDPVEQFRHEVYGEWVRRVPAAEKGEKRLAAYDLGPGFLDSVDRVEGVSRAKIVAVAVEVLIGHVAGLSGRQAHQLRTGDAGTPSVTRPDGATCWRVALQQETAAARRLHYWRLKDYYEFSRVVLHDDFRP